MVHTDIRHINSMCSTSFSENYHETVGVKNKMAAWFPAAMAAITGENV